MSTNLFCHGFGIVAYHYIRTEYREGDVIFTVSKKNSVFAAQFVKAKGS